MIIDDAFVQIPSVSAASVSTPATGSVKLFFDLSNSNRLSQKDSSGAVIDLASSGTTYTQGTGISIVGSVISVNATVVVRKYATSFGNGSATSFTITHNLGTLDVTVGVYEVSTGAEVEVDVVRTSTDVITLGTVVAPTASQYRVVVHG